MAEIQAETPQDQSNDFFAVKDCALIAIATGEKIVTAKELRNVLSTISPDSIYYHFWGNLLQSRFEEREYNNDFAAWARHGLHDRILAEQLAVIDPVRHSDLEDMRMALVDIIDDRLDASEYLRWVFASRQFEFIRSQIVVFDTGNRLQNPEQLADVIPKLSTSSIFYHFIDARRRLEDGSDDFRFWLSCFDEKYDPLCAQLANVDPYFCSLTELRTKLVEVFEHFFRS